MAILLVGTGGGVGDDGQGRGAGGSGGGGGGGVGIQSNLASPTLIVSVVFVALADAKVGPDADAAGQRMSITRNGPPSAVVSSDWASRL